MGHGACVWALHSDGTQGCPGGEKPAAVTAPKATAVSSPLCRGWRSARELSRNAALRLHQEPLSRRPPCYCAPPRGGGWERRAPPIAAYRRLSPPAPAHRLSEAPVAQHGRGGRGAAGGAGPPRAHHSPSANGGGRRQGAARRPRHGVTSAVPMAEGSAGGHGLVGGAGHGARRQQEEAAGHARRPHADPISRAEDKTTS